MLVLSIFLVLLFCFIAFWIVNLIYAQILGAPSVFANNKAIVDGFNLAKLKKGELAVDLGCGDARSLIIASRQFGARGVGVERSLYCFLRSRLNVYLSGQQSNIKIVYGDFRKVEKYLKEADIIYLYLLNSVLAREESWIFENLKKNARVVSLSFRFKNHIENQKIETENLGRKTKIYLYG